MGFCNTILFLSCLHSDVDNMLFDEIHNKRALQIMPLNTSPFLFPLSFFILLFSFSFVALLEKSFVIIIIVEATEKKNDSFLTKDRDHFNFIYILPERQKTNTYVVIILSQYISDQLYYFISYFTLSLSLSLCFSLRIPRGQALSSGLSS